MKFSAFLLSAALALPLAAAAQSSPNKSYVGLNAGASFALGDFGKADYFNNQAGFAKTGFHGALDGAYFFGGGVVGLAGQVAFTDNGRLTHDDLTKIGDGFTDGFGVDESTLRSDKRYRRLSAMVGPTFMFGGDKLKLEMRGLVGIVRSLSTPTLTVQLEDDDQTLLTQASSTSTVFGYQAGLGLHYALTDHLGIVLRGDYLGASNLSIDNANRANNAGRLQTQQPVSAINTSLGVAFAFGN
jgi:opacity protein-like surface antigen